MSDDDLMRMGELVAEDAHSLFTSLGFADDFCVQCVSGTTAVFGGTNRVKWSMRGGYRIDPSYCSDEFVLAWNNRDSS